jgi:hypothetical protein
LDSRQIVLEQVPRVIREEVAKVAADAVLGLIAK